MTLDSEHWIDVSVRDELGGPIAGAELEVSAPRRRAPFGAQVGADGTARVGRLPEGPWHMTARATGFEDETARATRDGEVVAVVLRKLGALTVHVVDAEDHGAAAARVSVAGATLWPAAGRRRRRRGRRAHRRARSRQLRLARGPGLPRLADRARCRAGPGRDEIGGAQARRGAVRRRARDRRRLRRRGADRGARLTLAEGGCRRSRSRRPPTAGGRARIGPDRAGRRGPRRARGRLHAPRRHHRRGPAARARRASRSFAPGVLTGRVRRRARLPGRRRHDRDRGVGPERRPRLRRSAALELPGRALPGRARGAGGALACRRARGRARARGADPALGRCGSVAGPRRAAPAARSSPG